MEHSRPKDLPQKNALPVDFASVRQKDAWLSHSIFGEPSFDSFVRRPCNPVHRGTPPREWPVNGFLFEDPVSGKWFIYVGHYSKDYAVGPGHYADCTVYVSGDRGESWEHLGPIFAERDFIFEGTTTPTDRMPDVSLVFEAGVYHLVCDCTTVGRDERGSFVRDESAIIYARSCHPAGPFIRHARPLLTGARLRANPILGKYNRLYGATLIRRRSDWLIVSLADSGGQFSWGLMAATAPRPDGPYSEIVPIFHTQGAHYQLPYLEYYPCFVHDGWLYAPATSVALNRNFQTLQRAPLEDAHRAGAWELHQHGSGWHGEANEYEKDGIWGQTYSGFVDQQGVFQVMFPSRDGAGMGTINLAQRPWDIPHREHGFVVSGHEGPSFTCLRQHHEEFALKTSFNLDGSAVLFWGRDAPLGPDLPQPNSTLHALVWRQYYAVEIEGRHWRFVRVDEHGARTIIAERNDLEPGAISCSIEHTKEGQVDLRVGSSPRWSGYLPSRKGAIGLVARPASVLHVDQFAVTGRACQSVVPLLHTEGLAGGGETILPQFSHWNQVSSPLFRFGTGAVSLREHGRLKWNFHGTGFRLWSPRNARAGVVSITLDGERVGEIDLRSGDEHGSSIVFQKEGLADIYHAVVVNAVSGFLHADVLEVIVDDS